MAEYYMFHKPKGCITARRDSRNKTVMDYFPEEKRDMLFPVGRLDKDTEGLVIITDDGKLCFNLLEPKRCIEKTYCFYILGSLSEEKRRRLEEGVNPYTDKSVITAPAKIVIESVSTLRDLRKFLSGKDVALANKKGDLPVTKGCITITEGKKHQVKRTFLYAGCRVVYLKRLSMAELFLDESLLPGEYRELTAAEFFLLKTKMGALN